MFTDAGEGSPGESKNPSMKLAVGVIAVSEPTFITPWLPTTNPCGFRKKTFPPIWPFCMEFNRPFTVVASEWTRFTRFSAVPGTWRLTISPEYTLNWENELKALIPWMVLVVTFVTLSTGADTWVLVMPSVTICAAKTIFERKKEKMVRTATIGLIVLDFLWNRRKKLQEEFLLVMCSST